MEWPLALRFSPAMAAVTENEVAAEFQDVTDRELIKRCVKLCQSYGISASDLGTKWEVMQMNSSKASHQMTFEQLAEFEITLKNAAPKRQKVSEARLSVSDARTQSITRPRSSSTFTKDSAHLLHSVLGDTPIKRNVRSERPTFSSPITPMSISGEVTISGDSIGMDASPTSGFSSRTDAGKVMNVLNPSLGKVSTIPAVDVCVKSDAAVEALPGASFMWEKLEERARQMDRAVSDLEQELIGLFGAKAEAVSSAPGDAPSSREDVSPTDETSRAPSVGADNPKVNLSTPPVASVLSAGPESATFVGRICCDGEGKLNPQSVFLEGSRRLSNACRVRLDLSECIEYALFPGQIVGVCGVNLHGHTIRVRTVIPGTLPPNSTPPSERQITPDAFNVMVAAGPYTTSSDLSFSPLDELLQQAADRRALVVVLIGPFIDEMHPNLLSGNFPGASFEQLFEARVMAKIDAFLSKAIADAPDGQATPHVVLVPSPRDLVALPIFPQPPLARGRFSTGVSSHVHLASNPARIDIGGISVATSSLDTLFMLTASELASAPQPGTPRPDRIMRLASHVLKQRLFMPLLPPPADVPVDITANMRAGGIDSLPDILILPSQLTPFAKVLPSVDGGALCINPGKLTRNTAGGTFALMSVHPRLQVDGARMTDIGVRTAVEILKI